MTGLALIAATLLTAGPPAADATRLADARAWDELYLRYSAANPGDYPPPDRAGIAAALTEGARALDDDPVLAVSLAEKAAAFDPSPSRWLLVGELNLRLGQKAAAASAFEKAITVAPDHVPALLARADLALSEGDWLLAQQLFARIPEGGAEYDRAQQGLAKARATQQEHAQRLARLQAAERDIARRAHGIRSPEPTRTTGALPRREVCERLEVGLCTLKQRCAASTPAPEHSGCASASITCSRAVRPTRVTRLMVEACLDGLEHLGCEALLAQTAHEARAAVPECRAIDEALSR
jgi:tetratricopeptide (TPR) repeat protein